MHFLSSLVTYLQHVGNSPADWFAKFQPVFTTCYKVLYGTKDAYPCLREFPNYSLIKPLWDTKGRQGHKIKIRVFYSCTMDSHYPKKSHTRECMFLRKIFYDTVNIASKCESFHSVGQGEVKVSQKRRWESLRCKRVPGTGWQRASLGRFLKKKTSNLGGGSQTKAIKRQGKKPLFGLVERPKSPTQSWKFCITLRVSLSQEAALHVGLTPALFIFL